MGLEKVKQEILLKAKQDCDKLREEGNRQAKEIMGRARKEASETREKAEQGIKTALEEMEKREIAAAELEMNKHLLNAKKDMINKVTEEARKRLSSLSSEKRESHIKKLIEKAKKELDISRIYCNSQDKAFFSDFDVVEQEMLGGFIAENKDQTIRVDYSFESLLQGAIENNLREIAETLFGKIEKK